MPVRRLILLGLALAVGGCDMPTDPVATNPYDPLFDGERIGTTPTGLRVASATPTSVTFEWDDVSSFETGYRIERRVDAPDRFAGTFEVVARLPPDATTYTWAGLVDLTPKSVRLVLEVAGEAESEPSDLLHIAYPTAAEVQVPRDGRLSPDARLYYARVNTGGYEVYRVATGAKVADVPFRVLRLAPYGQRAVAWNDFPADGSISVLENGELVSAFEYDFEDPISETVLGPNGDRLFVSWNDRLDVVEIPSGRVTRYDVEPTGPARGMERAPRAATPDGRYVAFDGSSDTDFRDPLFVFDLEHREIVWQDASAIFPHVTPDGHHLLITRVDGGAGTGMGLALLDLTTGAEVRAMEVEGSARGFAEDGASFVYDVWAIEGSRLAQRTAVGSTETLSLIRMVSRSSDARPLPGGQGVVQVIEGEGRSMIRTVRFDAPWEQVGEALPRTASARP